MISIIFLNQKNKYPNMTFKERIFIKHILFISCIFDLTLMNSRKKDLKRDNYKSFYFNYSKYKIKRQRTNAGV